MFRFTGYEGNGIFFGVGEGDRQTSESKTPGLVLRLAVEVESRLAIRLREYLNLMPTNTFGFLECLDCCFLYIVRRIKIRCSGAKTDYIYTLSFQLLCFGRNSYSGR